MKFYLDKIDSLATKGGYVPPTAEDGDANRKALGSVAGEAPAA